jgi:hypothetical protein
MAFCVWCDCPSIGALCLALETAKLTTKDNTLLLRLFSADQIHPDQFLIYRVRHVHCADVRRGAD